MRSTSLCPSLLRAASLLPLALLGLTGCEDYTVTVKPDQILDAIDAAADGRLDLIITFDEDVAADQVERRGGEAASAPACGSSTARSFFIPRLQLLLDPVDGDDLGWDPTEGRVDRFDERRRSLALDLDRLVSEASPYAVDDLLEPLLADHEELLRAPGLAPDPSLAWTELGAARVSFDRSAAGVEDDHHMVPLVNLSLELEDDEDAVLIEIDDADDGDDTPAGYAFLTLHALRALADCGPTIERYGDDLLTVSNNRVRALGVEVQSR